jgi:hypothetical protein
MRRWRPRCLRSRWARPYRSPYHVAVLDHARSGGAPPRRLARRIVVAHLPRRRSIARASNPRCPSSRPKKRRGLPKRVAAPGTRQGGMASTARGSRRARARGRSPPFQRGVVPIASPVTSTASTCVQPSLSTSSRVAGRKGRLFIWSLATVYLLRGHVPVNLDTSYRVKIQFIHDAPYQKRSPALSPAHYVQLSIYLAIKE